MKHYIIVFAFILLGGQGLFAQGNISSPYYVGAYSSPFTFTNTQNTDLLADDPESPLNDVYYKVTISSPLALEVSTCGSEVDATKASILDEEGNFLTDAWEQNGYGGCPNSQHATITLDYLPPGTYYFVVQGWDYNGNITTTITGYPCGGGVRAGDTMNDSFEVGAQNTDFTYIDTQDTYSFVNNYGFSSRDLFYHFTISKPMTVTISHCGSELSNTHLYLLTEQGGTIAENDDYSGVGHCTNTYQSYIRQQLPPGSYYVMSEGYGTLNGNITTNIQGVAAPSGTILAGSSGQNYIFTIIPTVASPTAANLTTDKSLQTLQYFDGLGRPMQTVQGRITPTEADLVTGIEYDGFGRDYRHWLPGAATGNNGAYVSDFGAKAASTNGGDARPYVETILESSPLNRSLGQHQPGADWYTHPTGIDYKTNAAGEVIRFSVENNQLKRDGNYDPNSLYKTIVSDEDGKTSIEYKDKLGQVVLKRGEEGGHVDTYYAYNDIGQLCYVIPPKAVDELPSDLNDENPVLKQYCYLYRYDERGNNIYKRLPGCEPIYMVYDKTNRLLLSQDGNQRPSNKWTVIKYDINMLGRVIYTAVVIDGTSYADQLSRFKDWIVTESFTTGAQPYPMENTGYSRGWYHMAPTQLLTVSYYDDYSFLDLIPEQKANLIYDNSQEQNGYTRRYSNTKGLLTGTRTYHLDDPTKYETTALYYDKYSRVIQSRGTNQLGGYDLVYNALDFLGKPTKTYKTHGINGTTVSVTELYTYDYDKAQRPTTTKYSLNGGSLVTLVSNTYDDLGRLTTKKRHSNADTETYAYNVRNWVTNITSGGFAENLYYNANPLNTNATYNGNISYSTWTYNGATKGYLYDYDGLNRLLSSNFKQVSSGLGDDSFNEAFTYDKMGNILTLKRKKNCTQIDDLVFHYSNNEKSNQLQYVDDGGTTQNQYLIKEYQNKSSAQAEFEYDANGNMKKDLDRDIATIRYNVLNLPDVVQFKNGNQIKNTYNAGGQKLGTEYFTWLPGANAPVVNIGDVLNISYSQGAIDQNGTVYIGNVEYNTKNGNSSLTAISRIYNAEGYVEIPSNPQYYYYRKDHLGDNREVWLANTGETVQRTQYYPSGLPWASNSGDNPGKQQRKYNGKEFVEMHGYDTYDYGARGYYPASSRFTSVDPHAKKYYSISPYAYCAGNPVRYVDVQGKWIEDSNGNNAYVNGKWSNNTSTGTRVIGNDLQLTPIGREQFKAMVNAPYPVKFILDPGINQDRNARGSYKLDNNGKIKSATLTVFEGNAKETLKNIKQASEKHNIVFSGNDDKERVRNNTKTVDEIIGQEAVHETTHFTRRNLSNNESPNESVREGEPNAAEIKAIEQTPGVRIETIPTPQIGIKIEPTK